VRTQKPNTNQFGQFGTPNHKIIQTQEINKKTALISLHTQRQTINRQYFDSARLGVPDHRAVTCQRH